MTYLDYLEQKVLLERLVIGLEEPVLVKGLGELSAKIDSGNGGYNVIHGTDFHQQGDELMFTTHDSFGHEKKMQAKIIDTIDVNMGGGNIESRPVIELDIKFAGEDYKKIPFSVSDRSTNSNPILISKGFVENELEALIDVGAMNISHEGIDVVYGESYILDEGFWSNVGKGLKTLGKTAWDGAKGIASGIKNADTWLKGGDNVSLMSPITGGIKNVAKALSPIGIGLYALWNGAKGALEFKKTQDMASNIANGNTFVTDDYKKISKQIIGLTLQNNLSKDKEVDFSTNIIKQWADKSIDPSMMPLSLVTSFMMTKGEISGKNTIKGLENEKEAWKELIQAAKETTKKMKEEKAANNQQPQAQEQEEITEAYIMFKEAGENLQSETSSVAPSPISSTTEPIDSKEKTIEDGSNKADELKEITTQFEQLNTFTLWFISIENDIREKELIEKEIKKLEQTLEKLEAEQKQQQKTPSEVIKDAFNPLQKKTPESVEKEIATLKNKLSNIGLPHKDSAESSLQKYFKTAELDDILYYFFKKGSIDANSSSVMIKKLAEKLQKDGKQGFFCLAWTPQSQTELKDDMKEVKREYYFFEKPEFIAYAKSSNPQEDEEWINSKLNFFKSKGFI